jgi:hypothetical protein
MTIQYTASDNIHFSMKTHKIHRLRNETAGHADVNSRLLSIASQNPYFDAGLLKRMNRIRDTLLQLVLDGSGPQQKQVLFNHFGRVIQSLTTPIDRGRRLIIDHRPLLIFFFGQVSVGNAKCSQTFRSIVLQS